MTQNELSGRTIVVTGANTGIGRATAEELARRGARVILACRSRDKAIPVVEGITAAGGSAEFVALDLADLQSVRACADELCSRDAPIDVLINNAGLGGLRGETCQGFELTFGTNHLGHFLLAQRLLPRLRAGGCARIVNVSSGSHYQAKRIDWERFQGRTRSVTGLPEYEVSKLCNVLFTKELSRRPEYQGIHAYALHPGFVASDAFRQVPWPIRTVLKLLQISNEAGAKTSIYCATSPDVAGDNGIYYDKCRPKKPNRLAEDTALARELWTRSEAWVTEFSR